MAVVRPPPDGGKSAQWPRLRFLRQKRNPDARKCQGPRENQRPSAGMNLGQPLLVDRSAFKTAEEQGDLRTDLCVPFGDGEYRFFLGDSQVRQIEFGRSVASSFVAPGAAASIGAVYSKLCRGRALFPSGAPVWAGIGVSDPGESNFSRSDIEMVIGHALVGGGEGIVKGKRVAVDADRARDLLRRYVFDKPLEPNWTLAFAIVGVRLFGRQPDPETGE